MLNERIFALLISATFEAVMDGNVKSRHIFTRNVNFGAAEIIKLKKKEVNVPGQRTFPESSATTMSFVSTRTSALGLNTYISSSVEMI